MHKDGTHVSLSGEMLEQVRSFGDERVHLAPEAVERVWRTGRREVPLDVAELLRAAEV